MSDIEWVFPFVPYASGVSEISILFDSQVSYVRYGDMIVGN
jgi:hypothetical protein